MLRPFLLCARVWLSRTLDRCSKDASARTAIEELVSRIGPPGQRDLVTRGGSETETATFIKTALGNHPASLRLTSLYLDGVFNFKPHELT
jgi:hypothetical protein